MCVCIRDCACEYKYIFCVRHIVKVCVCIIIYVSERGRGGGEITQLRENFLRARNTCPLGANASTGKKFSI